jgi:hypothetical protein
MEFLSDWQKINPRVDVISPSFTPLARLPGPSPLPQQSVAHCRNAYRTYVLDNYAAFDYVIVFQADLLGGWSFDGIAHSFGDANWDVVGSYGLRQRSERQRDEPPFAHFDPLAFRPRRETPLATSLHDGELNLHRGRQLLSVDSCFGGLAIYRLECLRLADYGTAACEHVVFHDQLKRSTLDRIFLNPSQIVVHTPL